MPIINAADLKAHLKITDVVDDTPIATAVAATNTAIINYCGRSFEAPADEATPRLFYPDGYYLTVVDDIANITDLAVVTDTTDLGVFDQTWGPTDYQLEPLNGLDGGLEVPFHRVRAVAALLFPAYNRRASVKITANWGWTVLPDPVFQAALIKAARLFKRKDSPEGVLGGFADLGAVRVSLQDDPDVCMLLSPYRRMEAVTA